MRDSQDALHVLSKDVFLKVVLPDWVPNWLITMRLRTVRVAYDELEVRLVLSFWNG